MLADVRLKHEFCFFWNTNSNLEFERTYNIMQTIVKWLKTKYNCTIKHNEEEENIIHNIWIIRMYYQKQVQQRHYGHSSKPHLYHNIKSYEITCVLTSSLIPFFTRTKSSKRPSLVMYVRTNSKRASMFLHFWMFHEGVLLGGDKTIGIERPYGKSTTIKSNLPKVQASKTPFWCVQNSFKIFWFINNQNQYIWHIIDRLKIK